MEPPIGLPDSIFLVKKVFERAQELSVFVGNICADAFETNSTVNDSIVK